MHIHSYIEQNISIYSYLYLIIHLIPTSVTIHYDAMCFSSCAFVVFVCTYGL